MFTVLGASGFVGSRLVASLSAGGIEVFAPHRHDTSFYTRPLGHVLYCIGLTADFRSRPFETVDAHVCVLNRLLRTGDFVSLTYLSTTRVYIGGADGREESRLSVSSLDPPDLYNLTKLTGESICFNSGRDGVRVARLSNVVGDDTRSANFIFDIGRDALRGHVKLMTHRESAKDYIAIDDVVDLLPLIATQGRERLYNLAAGVKVSHGEWLDRLMSLTGCTVEVAPGAPIVGFPDIDVSRISTEFAYRPRPVLDDLPGILSKLKTEMIDEVK